MLNMYAFYALLFRESAAGLDSRISSWPSIMSTYIPHDPASLPFREDKQGELARIGYRVTMNALAPFLADTGLPDLRINQILFNPAKPNAGDEVVFTAAVRNDGTNATAPDTRITVSFTIDGNVVGWVDTTLEDPIMPHTFRMVRMNGGPNGSSAWTATAGSYTVIALVDYLNLISESDKTNNEYRWMIQVSGSGSARNMPSNSGSRRMLIVNGRPVMFIDYSFEKRDFLSFYNPRGILVYKTAVTPERNLLVNIGHQLPAHGLYFLGVGNAPDNVSKTFRFINLPGTQ